MRYAGVAELVDALGLGSSDESCGGSSPSARTRRFSFAQDILEETSLAGTCPPHHRCIPNGSAAEWFVSNRLTTTRLRRVKPEED